MIVESRSDMMIQTTSVLYVRFEGGREGFVKSITMSPAGTVERLELTLNEYEACDVNEATMRAVAAKFINAFITMSTKVKV